MTNTRIALVVGANGGIGQATCAALRRHGWQVRALVRRRPAAADPHIDWREGDAMQAGDVLDAAQGVQVIVHAVNPPGYRGWERLVLPMLEHSLAAARTQGARLVLPGTIYNYGADAFPLLHEEAAQHPPTRKGELRVAMEQRLQAASRDGVRALVLRCGDFFGPQAGNNWFAQGLLRAGRPVTRLSYPGDYAIGHSWAYLPDVAETLARLLEREADLAPFERLHFAGHWLDGHALLAAIRRASGNPAVRAGRFPWWLMRLASPFQETLRELCQMRYLWRTPIALDGRRLRGLLGEEVHTPIDQAVGAALAGAGCLPASAARA